MDDEELFKQFENLSLPFAQWTHRAHVKVAYLYLSAHPFDQALVLMRKGIKAYNAANKVPESSTSGYNEMEALRRFGKGIHGFIQKPYIPRKLAEKIRTILAT